MKITAFAAGVRSPSSTSRLAGLISSQLQRATGAGVTPIELREIGASLVSATLQGPPAPDLNNALNEVEQADLLIAATPTFRGSYAGLFKAFFDLVEPAAMRNKPVILAATGGSARHQQVIDLAMRPLFGYFGSLVIPTAVFAGPDDWLAAGVPTTELSERVERITQQVCTVMRGQCVEPVG